MSGSPSTQTTTSTSEPWKAQQPYLRDLFSAAQGYYNRGTPDTSASQDLRGQAVGALTNAAGGLQDYISAITQANQGYATGDLLNPANNPAFQQYLNLSNQAIGNIYGEQVLPQLTTGAVQAGNIGSSRQGIAEALSAGKVMDAIQRNTAGLTDAAYGRGLQATLQAQQLAPALAKLGLLPAGALETAGGIQYGLDTEKDRLEKERLAAYQALISGNYGGTTTQTGPATSSGGLLGAFGGAAMGYQIGATPGAAVGALAGYFS